MGCVGEGGGVGGVGGSGGSVGRKGGGGGTARVKRGRRRRKGRRRGGNILCFRLVVVDSKKGREDRIEAGSFDKDSRQPGFSPLYISSSLISSNH